MEQAFVQGLQIQFGAAILQAHAVVHAGVIHQGIEAAELFDGLRHGAGTFFGLGEIDGNVSATLAGFPQPGAEGLPGRRVAVKHNRNRAFLAGGAGNGLPNAFGPAGHYHDPVFDLQIQYCLVWTPGWNLKTYPITKRRASRG
jgi:hypothetical protein